MRIPATPSEILESTWTQGQIEGHHLALCGSWTRVRGGRGDSHKQPPEAVDVSQGQRDVDKHDDVADDHRADVAVALPVDLILDAPLRAEGDGQVGVFVVLHETDESEMDVQEQNECGRHLKYIYTTHTHTQTHVSTHLNIYACT